MTTRRTLLSQALALTPAAFAQPSPASQTQLAFPDILRTPDYAAAYTTSGPLPLILAGNAWSTRGLSVETEPTARSLPIRLSSPGVEPIRLHLRWRLAIPGNPLLLGDAWERSYGELGWRSIVPERVMPWYFLLLAGSALHGFGVQTGAAALCFWQLDRQGISLWLDTSNGGSGVQLGDRTLLAATVLTRPGQPGEDSMVAARAFCRQLSPKPRLLNAPLYGANDWYYCYGKNSADQTLRDASLVAELAPSDHPVRPCAIIDDGWDRGAAAFPDMPGLARNIKAHQVRPGLWIRPLLADKSAPRNLLLPDARFGKQAQRARDLAFDPTIPEALTLITRKAKEPVAWGYEILKHDFSTYDLLGKWGNEMGPEPTAPGWHLNDRTRTNAEIITALYAALRQAAGEKTILIGCNTVGHLSAGLFEAQRTGDDTSGRDWERTRRMGINTLAFRLPQHNTFFALDPDCVGITPQISWDLNRQWLDLLAQTGVALFLSPDPRATGPAQKEAIRQAFALTLSGAPPATPAHWTSDTTPESWQSPTGPKHYDWSNPAGVSPFPI